jgi:autophagy-related protein 13
MHQQSRHPPRVYSPASLPQTNPARTNNPRDRVRAAASDTASSLDGGSEGAESFDSGPSTESIKKLDQIIQVRTSDAPRDASEWSSLTFYQNFYAKAAVLVLQSRLNTTPIGGRRINARKPNRWVTYPTNDTWTVTQN